MAGRVGAEHFLGGREEEKKWGRMLFNKASQ
jgi:hypothetical protein